MRRWTITQTGAFGAWNTGRRYFTLRGAQSAAGRLTQRNEVTDWKGSPEYLPVFKVTQHQRAA